MMKPTEEAQWEQILTPIEAERTQVHKKRKLYGIAMAAIGLLAAACFVAMLDPMLKKAPNYQFWLIIIGFIGGIAGLIYLGSLRYRLYTSYQDSMRVKIIQPLLAQLYPSLHHSPRAWVERSAYEQSGLCGEVLSKYEGEDLLAGKIGNFDIQVSDLTAYRRGQKHSVITFKGHFGIAKLAAPLGISGEVLILHQQPQNWASGESSSINTGTKKEIFSQSPTFNQHYKVFVSGEQPAAQLLTAELCDWLEKIAHLRISIALQPQQIAYTWADAGDLLATDPALPLNAAQLQAIGKEIQAKIRVFERIYEFLKPKTTK